MNTRNYIVKVRLSHAEFSALDKIKEKTGLTKSEILRDCLLFKYQEWQKSGEKKW